MHNITNLWIWFGFSVFLILALSADTFLLKNTHARSHASLRIAFMWSFVWIASALIFNVVLWLYLYQTTTPSFANQKGLDFLTGYLIEKSLSFDNLFAFYTIFHQFHIPAAFQQRVLSIGIWTAVVLRLFLILIGSWLVRDFHWLLYLMGLFLLLTGIKMFFVSHKEKDLAMSKTFIWLKKIVRITDKTEGDHFFIRKNSLLYATPLFVALVFVELSDIVFAFDSIPAIFAITTDPFIVWTSNIFAILGLRALYFVLLNMIQRFYLLKYGIALILVFVGTKMLIAPWIKITSGFSLLAVSMILLTFIILSLVTSRSAKGK